MGDETAAEPAPELDRRRGWLAWAAASAVAPGWAAYAQTRPDPGAFVETNAQLAASLGAAFAYMLGSTIAVGLLWWGLIRLRARSGNRTTSPWREVVLQTRLIVAAPLAVGLAHDSEGFMSLQRPVLIVACALLFACSVVRWGAPPRRWLEAVVRRMGGPRWPALVLSIAGGMTALFLARIALQRHHGFHTRAYDLGIYDNVVWNTTHGNFLGCSLMRGDTHLSAHFDPILVFMVPVYALAPRAETLLIVQALWVLSSVIPLYLIARTHLVDDRVGATLVSLCALAYPSVHGVVLNEFHSLALLAPIALWWLYFLDRGSMRGYWICFALVLLVREDTSLFAVGIGSYAIISTRHRRAGLVTIALALAWLGLVKGVVMPDSRLLAETTEEAIGYANRYRRLIPAGGGARDGVMTLLTNPGFVLSHVVTGPKVAAAIVFLLPLGLLPLLAGRRLLICVYGTAFIFLSSHRSLFYPLFHYSSVLYPMLLASLPFGISRARDWLERLGWSPATARTGVYAWLGSCALASSLTMAAWTENRPFTLHTPVPHGLSAEERETYAWFQRASAEIPADASVSASNRMAPHLSNRHKLRILQQRIESEFIVIHREDMNDEHQNWALGLTRDARYEEMARLDGKFLILRRRGGEDRKAPDE